MPKNDHCCVFGCTNRRSKKAGFSFHSFPSSEEQKRKWIQAIRREEGEHFLVTDDTVVCSAHFERGCYFPPKIQKEAPGTTGNGKPKKKCPRLHPGSVPTLFSFRPAPVKRPAPEDRKSVQAGRAAEYEDAMKAKRECPRPGQSLLEFSLNKELKDAVEKISALEKEVSSLKAEVQLVRSQLIRYINIKEDPVQMKFMTGLTPALWDVLWSYLKPSTANVISARTAEREHTSGRLIAQGSGRRSKVSLEDQLLMLMVRMRLGRLEEEIGYMFAVDVSTVSRILNMWTSYVYLRLGMLPIWPKWEQVEKSMPSAFVRYYPDTFIIIDATELPVETPTSLSLQSKLYSSYKKHCTVKGLVGITPNGMFSFISQLYTGSIGDKELTKDCGILPLLETVPPGKNVMADRGFAIQDLLVKPNLVLNMPPFKGTQPTLTMSQVKKTQRVASVRIHVERAIGRVKRLFHIFDRDIPLNMLGSINQIWSICCSISNLFGPLTFEKDTKYV